MVLRISGPQEDGTYRAYLLDANQLVVGEGLSREAAIEAFRAVFISKLDRLLVDKDYQIDDEDIAHALRSRNMADRINGSDPGLDEHLGVKYAQTDRLSRIGFDKEFD